MMVHVTVCLFGEVISFLGEGKYYSVRLTVCLFEEVISCQGEGYLIHKLHAYLGKSFPSTVAFWRCYFLSRDG